MGMVNGCGDVCFTACNDGLGLFQPEFERARVSLELKSGGLRQDSAVCGQHI
jgi:hypothetical protein